MSSDMILIILALVCFGLATIGTDVKINAMALGLFLLTLTLLT
jgi:hypothetical protein